MLTQQQQTHRNNQSEHTHIQNDALEHVEVDCDRLLCFEGFLLNH